MRAVRLEPERREPPVCADFERIAAVRVFERAVRVHRAFTEPFTVVPLERRADCAYRVTGASGEGYVVDVVDGSGLHDVCDCPDFLSNELGTCKHLEAVRRAIGSNGRRRAAFAKLPRDPREPVLGVDALNGLCLRVLGRWSAKQRARWEKVLHPDPTRPTRRPVEGGRGVDGVRVACGAAIARAMIEARSALDARREAVARELADEPIDADVLLHPLFPYQREGVLHLVAAGRAILADDMGLGKTVQAIAACEVLRRRDEARRVLIVTVASIKHQWAQEIRRYAGERAVIVAGSAAERRRALAKNAPYTILNYELTWRELSKLRELRPDVLILDEAQRAKNFRSKTAATLRRIPSRHLFLLTGTPVENRLDDLYSLLQLVDPRILGPLYRFNVDFHRQNERGRITAYKNLAELRARIAKVVLRRRKEQVLHDLPERVEQTRYTRMTPEQLELDRAYRGEAAQLLAIAERRPLRLPEQKRLMASLLKARQACNALELCDPSRQKKASPKLDELEELLAEILAEDAGKVLVFSEWVEMLKLAAARLEKNGVGYEMLHGGVASDKRPALLERFRSDRRVRVLLSTDAGGVGVNLQAASFVIHLDLPWNPGKLDQRTARAHRLGQTRGVLVTYLCAEKGIERGIEGTLATKRRVRVAALDADATDDAIETRSFTTFLRDMQELLVVADAPPIEIAPEEPPPEPAPEPAPASASESASESAPGSASASAPAWEARARERLRLAKLVRDAGFFGDALRAAYEALATAIAGVAGAGAPESHTALVAVVYRDLLPAGAIAMEAVSALARLHDLTSLERSGVVVDAALAEAAMEEADAWTTKLACVPEPRVPC